MNPTESTPPEASPQGRRREAGLEELLPGDEPLLARGHGSDPLLQDAPQRTKSSTAGVPVRAGSCFCSGRGRNVPATRSSDSPLAKRARQTGRTCHRIRPLPPKVDCARSDHGERSHARWGTDMEGWAARGRLARAGARVRARWYPPTHAGGGWEQLPWSGGSNSRGGREQPPRSGGSSSRGVVGAAVRGRREQPPWSAAVAPHPNSRRAPAGAGALPGSSRRCAFAAVSPRPRGTGRGRRRFPGRPGPRPAPRTAAGSPRRRRPARP